MTHPTELKDVVVTINPQNVLPDRVSSLLYAGFLEHQGRCIYGGLVDDPNDPSPRDVLVSAPNGALGWRKDVMDVIKGLETPMIRWPGGNFVSNYHWQDGIGPIGERPNVMELAWGGEESNKFGTDEFVEYCKAVKCEPYICLNMGTGTLQDALAWLEYCNGKGDTRWANLRRKHTGRDEPHGVKYWGLGNEMWGWWQVGNLSAAEYAERARQWAHAMRLVDPDIKLVSCGREGNSEWDAVVLEVLAGSVDLHSIHFYSSQGYETNPTVKGLEYEANVFGPAAAERSIEVCQSLIDVVTIDRMGRTEPHGGPLPIREIKIAFDEWNVWDPLKAPASNGLVQHYDYTDMLGFVAWLNLLLRQHQKLGLACLAQTVNAIAPILTDRSRVLKQTIFYPLDLFSRLMKGGYVLQMGAAAEVYSGPTHPRWIQRIAPPAYVDMVGMFDPDTRTIRLSLLNRHPTVDARVDLRFDGFEVKQGKVWEMYSDDLSAKNTFNHPDAVVPKVKEFSDEVVLRKHSWQFIELK